MGKLILDITVSVDGFVAGTDISKAHPMGLQGQSLHHWMFRDNTEADAALLNELTASTGAVILGHHTYETAIEDAWSGQNPFSTPAFVLVNRAPKAVAGFTYIRDGINSALQQAKVAAGDKDVWLMGGAQTIQQYIKAGLVEEIQLHIAPVLFGAGRRLFDHIGSEHIPLQKIKAVETPGALHVRYLVKKSRHDSI
jgi:dihydrofolate reductase